MNSKATRYDLIIVGGGLAGSTLGKVMAEQGKSVLIVERELVFKDRIRGEGMCPWGVTEARELGILPLLFQAGAHETRWYYRYFADRLFDQRDLVDTSQHHAGWLNFSHPKMQETLLAAAQSAGAEVRRGVSVTDVTPGLEPGVHLSSGGSSESVKARLVVGADGRSSVTRARAGFEILRDTPELLVAGALFENIPVPEYAVHNVLNPSIGQFNIIFPIGGNRFRCYLIHRLRNESGRMNGEKNLHRYLDACHATGVPLKWYRGARLIGPLGNFEGAYQWVKSAYREGVVLVGDSAGATDPSWGCGLSLTLRDVRVLRDQLKATSDWHAAAETYAQQRTGYFDALHRIHDMNRELLTETGAEADARRARAFPKLMEDPSRRPDFIGIGPEAPSDENARRRFFGDD